MKAQPKKRTETKERNPRKKMNPESELLLTFADAARVLSVSLRQLRRIVDDGRLSIVRVSERTPRVKLSDIREFISAATVKGQTSHIV